MAEKSNHNQNNILSVIIRARNAAVELNRCLSSLQKQRLPLNSRLEIIVVDNDSTDTSRFIASQRGAVIVPISRDDFSWGRALNVGLSRATGKIALILSSDAYPVDENWLSEMIKPFDDPEIVAVYGRQLPLPDAPIDERVRLEKQFGVHTLHFDKNNAGILPTGKGLIASNACAAIRTSAWRQLPYDEEKKAAEDRLWSYNMLQKGYSTIYQPSAIVYHSHRDSVLKFAWRQWELFGKDAFLKKIALTKGVIIKYSAAMAKRRIKNCTWPGIPIGVRIEGLIRLPWEMLAFLIIGFWMGETEDNLKYRRLCWK